MENLLKQHNLKITPQRVILLNIINSYGHINIDDLFNEVKLSFASISLATIYKNIDTMIKNKLLNEVKLPSRKPVYEIAKAKHCHLLCEKCGEVTDINLDLDCIKIDSSYNFYETSKELIIKGICKSCKN